MKDFDIVILIILVIVVSTGLFFGITTAVKKSFKTKPTIDISETQRSQDEQQKRIEHINQRQKDLYRSQQRRIKDLSR